MRNHNIDVVATMVAQQEAQTKKLDKLTQNVSMVHQPVLVYEGCGADHSKLSFGLHACLSA